MPFWIGAFATLILAARLQGQAAPTPPPLQQITPRPVPQVVYQVDLVPTGHALALGKPVLEGDVYVFLAFPDKVTARIPKEKVKGIKQRTNDLSKEVVYQIDLVPTGRMISRENPTLKGKTYVFHTWRDGTLMSLRQEDVRTITRLVGLPAFRVQQEETGAARIDNLPMQGGGTVQILSTGDEAAPAPTSAEPAGGNWSYEGAPGVTDAYAPPSAVVSSPGDVPKAAPTPKPQR